MINVQEPPLNDGALKGGHHMSMQSDNRSSHGLANNLAVQVTVFVIVMAAVIVVASRYLW
jgi:hypothetical protein